MRIGLEDDAGYLSFDGSLSECARGKHTHEEENQSELASE